MLDTTKLRRVGEQLKKLRPNWNFRTYTIREAEQDGRFDPPCAFLKRDCTMTNYGIVQFELTSDGELYLHIGQDVAIKQLVASMFPSQIAKQISKEIDSML